MKAKQPGVFSQGCVCHLANLCLLQGIKSLPIDVDDFFVVTLINHSNAKNSYMNFKNSLEQNN